MSARLPKWTRFSNAVLSLTMLGSFATFVFFFYKYSLTGQRQFTSPMGPLLYYVMPIFLAFVCVAALRLVPIFRLVLALVLTVFSVFIFGTELLLAYAEIGLTGPSVETRSSLEVSIDLSKQISGAVPAIYPWDLLRPQSDGSVKSAFSIDGSELLPLGGISGRVTVFCNDSGKFAVYYSDEHGFSNPVGWKPGDVDIAALGDSFTQGACLPPQKSAVALIRDRFPGTLNLGFDGDGPLMMLATLKEYLTVLKPKLTLWFYYERNDLVDLLTEKESPLLRRYLKDHFSQRLFERQQDIDRALSGYLDELIARHESQSVESVAGIMTDTLRLTRLRQRLGLLYGDATVNDNRKETPDWYSDRDVELLREILLEAKASTESWGGKLYFVYLPAVYRYTENKGYNRDSVLAMIHDTGLPVIDVHKAFQAQPDPTSLYEVSPLSPLPVRKFGHFNEEGGRVVAETVLKTLDGRFNDF